MAQVIALNSIFERLPAKNKKFREVVVFVHHYGGNKHSFLKHIEMVNELGFDAVTFDLPSRNLSELRAVPLSREWSLGLRHIWADKIEEVLGSLPENKIIYSFSYPSVAVLMALARRHAIDVRGWICDGGPFKNVMSGVENLIRSGAWHTTLGEAQQEPSRARNFFTRAVERIPLAQKLFIDFTALAFGMINYDRDVDQALRVLPVGFPVLSLRGEKDALVTPDMIDQFFMSGFGRIDLQRFTLHNSEHLLGLRTEGELYRQAVADFLRHRTTSVDATRI